MYMEWDEKIDLQRRKITTRLIIERAQMRGWRVAGFETNNALLLLSPPKSNKYFKVFSASPPQTSFAATKMTQDKYITNQILNFEGIRVPDEMLFKYNLTDKYRVEANTFISKHSRVVLKPLDGSHGNGITTNVYNEQTLMSAIEEATQYTTKKTLALQQYIDGIDIRIVCIGYKFANAISRVPASVLGDGKHTVEELINTVNESDERGENYKTNLNVIPMEQVKRYLSKDELTHIPDNGKTVQVVGVSNTGMGGIRLNITSNIPPFLIEIAEKASRSLGVPVSGVDFLVKRLPKKEDSYAELEPYVIEVNNCPSLFMYEDPYCDEQNKLIDQYLDYVVSVDKKDIK